MKKVSVAKPTRWAVGLSLLCAFSAAPIAYAQGTPGSWVIVSLEGDIELTEKTKTVGGDFQGSPQTFHSFTTYGSRMMVGMRTHVQAPSSGANTGYGGSSNPNGGGAGGSAMTMAKGSNFKVGLEWRGAGPVAKTCYLRVSPSAYIDISSRQWAWDLSTDTGLSPNPTIGPQSDSRSGPKTQDYEGYSPTSRMNGYKIIPIDTGGGTSCEKEISFAPTASANLTAKAYNVGSASAGISLSAEMSPRGISISGLGQTYRKSTTQPKTKAGQTPLAPIAGSSPPVWREPVDAEDTQESAAQWFPTRDVPADMWLGSVSFKANHEGFYLPTYSWTEPADGKSTGGITFETLNYSAVPPSNTDSYYGIKLGSKRNGSDLSKSSSVSVEVTDGEGSLADDYVVNWHLPYELGASLGDRIVPSLTPKSFRVDAGAIVSALAPGQRGEFATNQLTVDVKAGAEVWELIGSLATAVVGEIPVLGLPGELLLTAAGWQIGQVPDPQWNPTRHEFGYWRDAVNAQRQINQGLATGIERVTPSSLADDPLALDPVTTKAGHPWSKCKMSLIVKTDITYRSYELDRYGLNGYIGPDVGELPLPMTVTHEIYTFKESQ